MPGFTQVMRDAGPAGWTLIGLSVAALGVLAWVLLAVLRRRQEGPARGACVTGSVAGAALVAGCLATAWIGAAAARQDAYRAFHEEITDPATGGPIHDEQRSAMLGGALAREVDIVFLGGIALLWIGAVAAVAGGLPWTLRMRRAGRPAEGPIAASAGLFLLVIVPLALAMIVWSGGLARAFQLFSGASLEEKTERLAGGLLDAWSAASGWLRSAVIGAAVAAAAGVAASFRASRAGARVGAGTLSGSAGLLAAGIAAFALTRGHAERAANPPPEDHRIRLAEHEKLRLTLSTSRVELPGAAKIEIQADAIYCNNQRSALLREENGVRSVDELSKAGGRTSFLIEDLKEQLERYRSDMDEIEKRGNRTIETKTWVMIVADARTPIRIIKEVLFTAREAGYDQYFFAAKAYPEQKRFWNDAPLAVSIPVMRPATRQEQCTEEDLDSCGDREPRLGLTIIVTGGTTTLVADRAIADRVFPPDPNGGAPGRIEIGHLAIGAERIARARDQACAGTPAADFDDCTYWRFLDAWFGVCRRDAAGAAVAIPDLKAVHMALRSVKDRAVREFPQGLPDVHEVRIKSEDDLPWCDIAAVLDFARFRRFDYDPVLDTRARGAAGSEGAASPTNPLVLVDPGLWSEELRAEVLFPIVEFVD